MARTIVGLNDPKAVKKYSAMLAVDSRGQSYFGKKFMGVGVKSGMPIQMLPQLESDAGEAISYDLVVRLRGPSIEGDDNAAGTEARLSFFTDTVYIEQSRKGVDAGGRMTRKRTIHDLRDVAKNLLAEYWAAKFDEEFFMYLSGARGVNDGFNEPLGYTGRANNSFTAPDANHIIYGGAATSKATVASTDKASVTLIDKFVSRARMLNVNSSSIPAMKPIMVDGEERYVALFNPWQMYDIRTEAGAGKWLDIQKAAAAAEGQNNPIFKGNHGMYRGVVLHEHENVIQFSDYGAGSNVSAVRGLALGNQAGVCAFGSPGTGLRFDWTEETEDRGNRLIVTTNTIYGVKKATYNSIDIGVMALDTAAVAP